MLVPAAAPSSPRPAVVIGNGFVGTAVARALVAAGRPTTVVGRRPLDPPAGARTVVLPADDAAPWAELLLPGTDVVFAAGSSVPAHDELDVGPSLGAVHLLTDVLRTMSVVEGSTLLHVSSGGAVYGHPEVLPVPEDHPLRPISAYGATKVASEAYVAAASRRYGLPATNLRCGNAYGPGQDPGRPQGLVAELLAAASTPATVEVWGDGSATRDFIHVDDLARIVAALAGRTDLPDAVNVASGSGTSVAEVLEAVVAVTGTPIEVRWRPARPFDVSHVVLDTTRLRHFVDHEPMPLADGVAATWSALAGAPVV